MRRNLFEWTGCTIRRWLERARFLARSLVWLQSEKATFPAWEESVSENLNKNYKHRSTEKYITKLDEKNLSCDFHRNKREERLNNPSLRKNCSKNVRLNVILELSTFQKEKNISIFEQMHKEVLNGRQNQSIEG